ncbi:MAG: hypothetical protein GY854_33505 [Deltaproteobacteria bacterium]|nr:hypothetical protein [Deltaproteobacteria bacterium]
MTSTATDALDRAATISMVNDTMPPTVVLSLPVDGAVAREPTVTVDGFQRHCCRIGSYPAAASQLGIPPDGRVLVGGGSIHVRGARTERLPCSRTAGRLSEGQCCFIE